MRDVLLMLLHLAVVARLCGSGGVRAVIAENLLLKQQLIVLRRARRRAPNLTPSVRLLCGFTSLFLSAGRIQKVAIDRPSPVGAPSVSSGIGASQGPAAVSSAPPSPMKPGPKGPDEALVRMIIEVKSRNPRFGCPRIARIISRTFGLDIDKNVVSRVLEKDDRPAPRGGGPSWLGRASCQTDATGGDLDEEQHVLR